MINKDKYFHSGLSLELGNPRLLTMWVCWVIDTV